MLLFTRPPPSPTDEGHGGSRGILDKIKKYRVQRGRTKDEPDFSSFITFGQPLEDCPVSLENKVHTVLVLHHLVILASPHDTGITSQ